MEKTGLLISTLVICLLISACAALSPQSSLYHRIGGKEKLAKVVSEMVDTIASDPRTKRSFEDVKLPELKASITDQFCVISGGDCVYEGETMKNAHADAAITSAEFDLTVQALRDALDHQQIGTREKNELLKLLAPMKRDIVTN